MLTHHLERVFVIAVRLCGSHNCAFGGITDYSLAPKSVASLILTDPSWRDAAVVSH